MKHLPINAWRGNLQVAVTEIQRAAEQLLECDDGADQRGREIRRNWKLSERRADEFEALQIIEAAAGEILDTLSSVLAEPDEQGLGQAADVIDRNLPKLESQFVRLRHCAQDLLHWAGRFTGVEGDEAAHAYRSAFRELIRFTPVIRPQLQTLRDRLVQAVAHDPTASAESLLLASLNRYLGVMDSAYEFVRAIADPPLELVFEETELYLHALRGIDLETRRRIVSSINDCCQALLYQPMVFEEAVQPIGNDLPGDVDSSVVAFETERHCVVMAVDEDPIFRQLTIRLLGVAEQDFQQPLLVAIEQQISTEWH